MGRDAIRLTGRSGHRLISAMSQSSSVPNTSSPAFSLSGRTCLITGVTQGIGLVTARRLSALGPRVILAARDAVRGNALVEELKQAGNAQVELLVADLSSQRDIRELAKAVQATTDRLDVLVNNAGGMFNARNETVDGLERTFALNHLGYFLLTNELLPLLQRTAKTQGHARIVNVASDAHRRGRINFEDLQAKQSYSGFGVYCNSKLANVLFTYELARRLGKQGDANLTVNCLHPGFVDSGFGHNNSKLFSLALKVVATLFARNAEDGAQTSVYLASSPDVTTTTGQYFSDSKVARSNKRSHSEEDARKLWEISEELTRAKG
jgi:NAD(P)-dependent dehydrogenase (short-subunit alcohol dehydrogenase family)